MTSQSTFLLFSSIFDNMNCFVYLSLSAILKISSSQIFHFKKSGAKQTEEVVPNFEAADKVNKVVVDLQGSQFAVAVITPVSGELYCWTN